MIKFLLARARETRTAELEGEAGHEAGFTLIELMVVLLIIAILLAIAIPTFLGVTGSAKDRSAQSTLSNAITDMIAYYQPATTYDVNQGATATSNAQIGSTATSAESVALGQQEPSFTWQGGLSSGACATTNAGKCVSVYAADAASSNDGQAVILASMSASGTCWFAANLQYGSGANPAGNVATTGFSSNAASTVPATGNQTTGSTPALITTAGTYYSQLPNAGANCYAAYPETFSGGWSWSSSFSNAPKD